MIKTEATVYTGGARKGLFKCYLKTYALGIGLVLKLFMPNALVFLLTQLLFFQPAAHMTFSLIFPPPSEPFLGSFARILIAVVKFISLPSDSCLLALVKRAHGLSSFPNRQVLAT